MYSWCMWEKFIGICKLCFMDMEKFHGYVMGMCMDIFMGINKLCGYEILIYGKTLLGM